MHCYSGTLQIAVDLGQSWGSLYCAGSQRRTFSSHLHSGRLADSLRTLKHQRSHYHIRCRLQSNDMTPAKSQTATFSHPKAPMKRVLYGCWQASRLGPSFKATKSFWGLQRARKKEQPSVLWNKWGSCLHLQQMIRGILSLTWRSSWLILTKQFYR